jgi:hypothetical protein
MSHHLIITILIIAGLVGLYTILQKHQAVKGSRTLRVMLRILLVFSLLWAFFRPRTGSEIYSVIFGRDNHSCVNILNSHDASLPILDPDIYMELTTCPAEINRIIKLRPYPMFQMDNHPYDMINFQPPGDWFNPEKMGNKLLVLTWKPDSNYVKGLYMFISPDSSHAYIAEVGK